MELDERKIPVTPPVSAACEMLGLDPLYVANEGRLVAFVAEEVAEKVLTIMTNHSAAVGPAIIGRVVETSPGTVVLNGPFGGGRIVDLLSGEQLPRIC
jgi:hydrogenase expression/formation protein HypE